MVCGSLFVAGLAPPVAGAVSYELSPIALAIGVALAPIPALLPDIDHPSALLSRGWIPFGKKSGFLWKMIGWTLAMPPRIVGMISRGVMGHREGTHSLAFNALWAVGAVPLYGAFFFLLAYIFSMLADAFIPRLSFDPIEVGMWIWQTFPSAIPFAMLVVGIAYFSHLFVDCFNGTLRHASGCPWFWPVWKKKINFLPGPLAILRVPVTTPIMHPKEWLFQKIALIGTIALVILNVGWPVVERVQHGYNMIDAVAKTESDLAALPPR